MLTGGLHATMQYHLCDTDVVSLVKAAVSFSWGLSYRKGYFGNYIRLFLQRIFAGQSFFKYSNAAMQNLIGLLDQ